MATKRQRATEELTSLIEQLHLLLFYVPQEEKEDWFYSSEEERRDYWSQSRIDTCIRKAKKTLLQAKAARYDTIAPVYDQMQLESEDAMDRILYSPDGDLDCSKKLLS